MRLMVINVVTVSGVKMLVVSRKIMAVARRIILARVMGMI